MKKRTRKKRSSRIAKAASVRVKLRALRQAGTAYLNAVAAVAKAEGGPYPYKNRGKVRRKRKRVRR